ncbi:MAG: hypothetical protein KF789_13985 [Bdellovibrionaceae bacterium]|nr:hypothetical protein [Pseudobdellovibrionaceae bacterium]
MLRKFMICLILVSSSTAMAAPVDFLLEVVSGKTRQFGDYPSVGGNTKKADITKLFERSQNPRSRIKFHGQIKGKAALAEMTKDASNLWKALNSDYALAKDFQALITSRDWYLLSEQPDYYACSGATYHYVAKDMSVRFTMSFTSCY